nr:hypothetical protein [uncultured Campylobacter sp.]
MKFQNFIVLNLQNSRSEGLKFTSGGRDALRLFYLCAEHKRDKILAARKTQPNVIKLAVKSTSATSKMSVKTDKYKQSKSSRTSHA